MRFFECKCSFCKQDFAVSLEFEGELLWCPQCGKLFLMKQRDESRDSAMIPELVKHVERQHAVSDNTAAEKKMLQMLSDVSILLRWIVFFLVLVMVLLVISCVITTPRQIKEHKIVCYSWENSSEMEEKIKNALEEGFEPAGFLCPNGIRGGFYLFVKR